MPCNFNENVIRCMVETSWLTLKQLFVVFWLTERQDEGRSCVFQLWTVCDDAAAMAHSQRRVKSFLWLTHCPSCGRVWLGAVKPWTSSPSTRSIRLITSDEPVSTSRRQSIDADRN